MVNIYRHKRSRLRKNTSLVCVNQVGLNNLIACHKCVRGERTLDTQLSELYEFVSES
jgi:hypothetical protein